MGSAGSRLGWPGNWNRHTVFCDLCPGMGLCKSVGGTACWKCCCFLGTLVETDRHRHWNRKSLPPPIQIETAKCTFPHHFLSSSSSLVRTTNSPEAIFAAALFVRTKSNFSPLPLLHSFLPSFLSASSSSGCCRRCNGTMHWGRRMHQGCHENKNWT